MTDLLRQEIAAAANLVVVKVGTRVLTRSDGRLDEERIAALAEELNELIEGGRKVILVSSGAVGAGMSQLDMAQRPRDLAELQAVAAIGQTNLVEIYDRTLRKHGHHAAQVLLTADDLDNRTRYLNVRNTILKLLQFGAVPIINENDTVAVDELMATFGDNDRLAAMVTSLLRAPLLVILSDVDGLYDGAPHDGRSTLIHTVSRLNDAIFDLVRDRATGTSKGGMASKLAAARVVTAAGENVIIASGRRPGLLRQILAGKQVGTLIIAQGKAVSPWKRWIGYSAQTRGELTIDEGARRAIVKQGRSLLAAGIIGVAGNFKKGDVVLLRGQDASELARGLTNYTADEVRQIQGQKSAQIAKTLGRQPYQEVIHRDNMLVVS